MGFIRCYTKRIRFCFIRSTLLVALLVLISMNTNFRYEKQGPNFFYVYVNEALCGVLDSQTVAEKMFIEARKSVASEHNDLTFLDVQFTILPEEKISGVFDTPEEVKANIEEQLKRNVRTAITKSYNMKVNDTTVNVNSIEAVKNVLSGAVDKYISPEEAKYEIVIDKDKGRKFNVLCAQVRYVSPEEEDVPEAIPNLNLSGGVQAYLTGFEEEIETEPDEMEFEDYELGINTIYIVQNVDVTECYIPSDELSTEEEAIALLADEQDVQKEYVVVKGDTLSGIASSLDIPAEEIVAMNPELLKSTNSTLHIGDVLAINEPEPELTVRYIKRAYYEQDYQAEVQYVYNDSWYTTQSQVLQEPSTGFRKVIFDETYDNGVLVLQTVVKQQELVAAVPKIVEIGTKIPPTYIKPIKGGKLTSGFGPRGYVAGSNASHKGVDWAVPTGTAVYASNGGKVTKAGWGTGYGYCVYIKHDDGRETRYAHCSKVLVTAGQYVKQGDKIALSGNTGQSTGPHLHFEILIGGKQVNPLKYIE